MQLQIITEYKTDTIFNQIEATTINLPQRGIILKNYGFGISTSPMFHKVRINRLIDDFNLLFEGLTFQESINQSEFFKTFLTEYTKENPDI